MNFIVQISIVHNKFYTVTLVHILTQTNKISDKYDIPCILINSDFLVFKIIVKWTIKIVHKLQSSKDNIGLTITEKNFTSQNIITVQQKSLLINTHPIYLQSYYLHSCGGVQPLLKKKQLAINSVVHFTVILYIILIMLHIGYKIQIREYNDTETSMARGVTLNIKCTR